MTLLSVMLLGFGAFGIAEASPGKVKKADKLEMAYAAGDADALDAALATLEPAMGHPKVADDAAAWALLGHLRAEKARASGDREGLKAAGEDLAKAIGLGVDGAARERAVADAKGIIGVLLPRAADDFQSGRVEDAAAALAVVVPIRAALVGAKVRLDTVDEPLLTLLTQVHLAKGEVAMARAAHDELLGLDVFNPGLSAAVARAMAAGGAVDDALAMLTELAAAHGDPAQLLRAEVDLRVAQGDAAGAAARVDAVKDALWASVSGSFEVYELYLAAGSRESALAAALRVLELDAAHVDALVAAATLTTAAADASQAQIATGKLKYADKKKLVAQVAAQRKDVVKWLSAARDAAPTDLELLRKLAAAHRSNGDEAAAKGVDASIAELQRAGE